jgi:hypothetical protein
VTLRAEIRAQDVAGNAELSLDVVGRPDTHPRRLTAAEGPRSLSQE